MNQYATLRFRGGKSPEMNPRMLSYMEEETKSVEQVTKPVKQVTKPVKQQTEVKAFVCPAKPKSGKVTKSKPTKVWDPKKNAVMCSYAVDCKYGKMLCAMEYNWHKI